MPADSNDMRDNLKKFQEKGHLIKKNSNIMKNLKLVSKVKLKISKNK